MDTLLDRATDRPNGARCPSCRRIMTDDELLATCCPRTHTPTPFDAEALAICPRCEESEA